MIKKLTANLSIKLISLLVAVIIWVVIMNIINPVINGFVNLNINVKNENVVYEQNKTYFLLDSKSVRVSYKTKTDNQMNIKQSDFNAYIDLKDIEFIKDTDSNEKSLTVRLDISPEIDNIISNVQIEPSELKVAIDDVLRSEYKVQYNIVGNAGQGHSVGNVILSPSVVYVSGSNVSLGIIDHLSIDIPISNSEETFSGVSKIKIYAADGTILPNDGVMLSAEDIGYSVVLNSTANITLNAVTDGKVANGYRLVETHVNPSTVVIEGPRAFVQNIYTFDLPTINVEGFTESKEFKYKLSDILPVGVVSKTSEVTVSVIVDNNVINAPIEKEVGPHIDGAIDESASVITPKGSKTESEDNKS